MIDFVCATNNSIVLEKNLKRSVLFKQKHLILQEGYSNVPKAYNKAMKETKGKIICFLHQDVFLPNDWENNLLLSLKKLEKIDKDWGVLGVAGVIPNNYNGKQYVGHLLDRGSEWGSYAGLPMKVQTLDELLLIIKNDNSLKFDENIPTNHLYGADICMQAQAIGKNCYSINAYCHHNSATQTLPENFHPAAEYFYKKWSSSLPIFTTCVTFSKDGVTCP